MHLTYYTLDLNRPTFPRLFLDFSMTLTFDRRTMGPFQGLDLPHIIFSSSHRLPL